MPAKTNKKKQEQVSKKALQKKKEKLLEDKVSLVLVIQSSIKIKTHIFTAQNVFLLPDLRA